MGEVDIRRVRSVIMSCETVGQLETARKYAYLYLQSLQFDPVPVRWLEEELLELINTKRLELNPYVQEVFDCEVFLVSRL